MAHHLKWFLLLILLVAGACRPSAPPDEVVIEIGQEEFSMELAIHPEDIRNGLMNRTRIEPGKGMIFIFPESRVQSFWMAYCLVDIDLIFLDGTGRITAVHTMLKEPPRQEDETEATYLSRMPGYGSVFPARVALELPAGSIERLGLTVGQKSGLDMQFLEALRAKVATSQ